MEQKRSSFASPLISALYLFIVRIPWASLRLTLRLWSSFVFHTNIAFDWCIPWQRFARLGTRKHTPDAVRVSTCIAIVSSALRQKFHEYLVYIEYKWNSLKTESSTFQWNLSFIMCSHYCLAVSMHKQNALTNKFCAAAVPASDKITTQITLNAIIHYAFLRSPLWRAKALCEILAMTLSKR